MAISQSSALETRCQSFFQASWLTAERTATAYFHAHTAAPCLRPPGAVATVARDRAALLSASTHGRSILPPSLAYTVATAWLSCSRWSARELANPNQVTTPIGHRFSPDQTITVLDPRHPLCGRTLPLVALTHHAQLGRCCVVWLRAHVERLIPVQATNWAFDPTDLSPSPLSLAAIEQRSYWIPGSWHLRMVYTDGIPFHDPSQESDRAGQYQESRR